MELNSRIPGFYSLSIEERKKLIAELCNLSTEDLYHLETGVAAEILDMMSENVIGSVPLPFGIATNFKVNNKDYLIPMAVEESSVVAAASHAARIARKKGGFHAEYTGSISIGQLQILGIKDLDYAEKAIIDAKEELLEKANATNEILVKLGGGAKDLTLRRIKGNVETYLILHLIVDTKDAMGANAINTMLETIAPYVEEITKGRVLLRILSNYATERKVIVRAIFDKEALGGERIVDDIIRAYDLAKNDVYRAVTHNKGIMNGITSVMLATGNDTRAIEAAAHAFAARDGKYRSLSHFEKNKDGDLIGKLEMPLAAGIIGGAISINPIYKLALKILNVKTVKEFAEVVGSVGLAQNVAALRALVSEGIQKGHMRLHAQNIAATAGAKNEEIKIVAEKLIQSGKVTYDRAMEILKEIRKKKS